MGSPYSQAEVLLDRLEVRLEELSGRWDRQRILAGLPGLAASVKDGYAISRKWAEGYDRNCQQFDAYLDRKYASVARDRELARIDTLRRGVNRAQEKVDEAVRLLGPS